MRECLSQEQIINYLENPLGCSDDIPIEEHLVVCDKCVSDLAFFDSLRIGLAKFGEHSRKLVEAGKSSHLTNDEIPGYINGACNEDEKVRIVSHLAGCSSCLDDVFALKDLLVSLERESSIIKKSYILLKYTVNNPARIMSTQEAANSLIEEAVGRGYALFELEKQYVYAFKGEEKSGGKRGEDYRKIEIDDFTVEVTQTTGKAPHIIIGILARGDTENAKVTICAEEEKTEMVTLDNNRAIIKKANIKAGSIRYIRIEKV
jgi:hypothetical protein